MDRREALKYSAAILGGAILGAEAFLSGCTSVEDRTGLFSAEDVRLLDEIGETILPESDRSPGAKAARIGEFMKTIVTDCYDENETEIFRSGLDEVRRASAERYRLDFLKLAPQDRSALLTEFDRTARSQSEDGPVHFFTMIKQLTVWGYFSSEAGVTKTMRYDPVPGGYVGCVDYKDGDRAWHGPLSPIG